MTQVVLNGKNIILPKINKKEITIDSIDYDNELINTIEFKPDELLEKRYQDFSLENTLEFKEGINENEK